MVTEQLQAVAVHSEEVEEEDLLPPVCSEIVMPEAALTVAVVAGSELMGPAVVVVVVAGFLELEEAEVAADTLQLLVPVVLVVQVGGRWQWR